MSSGGRRRATVPVGRFGQRETPHLRCKAMHLGSRRWWAAGKPLQVRALGWPWMRCKAMHHSDDLFATVRSGLLIPSWVVPVLVREVVDGSELRAETHR